MGILFAAIDQDHDSSLFPGTSPIYVDALLRPPGLSINEVASVIVDLPGECLAAGALTANAPRRVIAMASRRSESIESSPSSAARKGEIARRGEHLPGAGKSK